MKAFKELLSSELKGTVPDSLMSSLPSGFQLVGKIALVEVKPRLKKYEGRIAGAILKNFSYIETVCSRGKISGKKREPDVRVIGGKKNTVTEHRENGCVYRLDVSKVMFAKGNTLERGRLPHIVRPNETVVDMFAGIGYFSIPVARACPSCKIISIDVNPVSMKFLGENCRLNKTDNVRPVLADCKEAAKHITRLADRVIMGYFPGTEKYLPAAFAMLKPTGMIHYHNVYRGEDMWKRPLAELKKAAEENGFKLEKILHKGIVKSYSPGKYHIVVDAVFRKVGEK